MDKIAYVFPGQGAQFPGMGQDLFEQSAQSRDLFSEADAILGFSISEQMFHGSDESLKQTKVTQPAVFLHSVISFLIMHTAAPQMTAGHSLGEFSALVAAGAISFQDGLKLVSLRAQAMQKACEHNPSTMAAVLGLDDNIVEAVCKEITDAGEIVVPANYNCPGQLVISGSLKGIELACEALKSKGAKRALPLSVGGAFHSPLMNEARQQLSEAISNTEFHAPICPVYQNFVAAPVSDALLIKENLINQLTAPVLWTQSMQAMLADGATHFYEVGPGKVLQGLMRKISKDVVFDHLG